LKWNDHHVSFFNIVEELCRTEQLCDVTLACGGQVFETHKLILSVCSPFFRAMLNTTDKQRHPIIYLKDVNPQHLELLLAYMYKGEINVLQNDLGPLIETAKGLQIKGLADAGDKSSDQSRPAPAENGGGHPLQPPTHQVPPLGKRPAPSPPKRILHNYQPKMPKIDTAKTVKITELAQSGQGLTPMPQVLTSSAVSVPPPTSVETPRLLTPVNIAPGNKDLQTKKSDSGLAPGLVKMEHVDHNEWAGMEEYPCENIQEKSSFEQELQQEDEQYIQAEGLSQEQINMLQKEIQKKYPCEFCHKRFPTPSKLHRHKLVHSGEKPYICHLCKKGFTQKVHLNTHMRQSHLAEMQYREQLEAAGGLPLVQHVQISGDDSNSASGLGDDGLEDGEVVLGSLGGTVDLKPTIIEDDLSRGEMGEEAASSDTENQLYMDVAE